MSMENKMIIYNATVLPSALYGIELSINFTATHLKKLDQAQARFARLICRLPNKCFSPIAM